MSSHTSRRLRLLAAALRSTEEPLLAAAPAAAIESGVVTDPEDEGTPLTQEQIEQFLEEGYCALPGLLPPDINQRLCDDMDRRVADANGARGGSTLQGRHIVSYKELANLCSLPMVVEKLKQLFKAYGNGETQMAMHHIHANRQLPGVGSSNWHRALWYRQRLPFYPGRCALKSSSVSSAQRITSSCRRQTVTN
jgi:hypothetical protein